MAIEIVSFPIKNGGSFHSYVKLPEDTWLSTEVDHRNLPCSSNAARDVDHRTVPPHTPPVRPGPGAEWDMDDFKCPRKWGNLTNKPSWI